MLRYRLVSPRTNYTSHPPPPHHPRLSRSSTGPRVRRGVESESVRRPSDHAHLQGYRNFLRGVLCLISIISLSCRNVPSDVCAVVNLAVASAVVSGGSHSKMWTAVLWTSSRRSGGRQGRVGPRVVVLRSPFRQAHGCRASPVLGRVRLSLPPLCRRTPSRTVVV